MDERDTYIKQLETTIKSLEQQVNNLTEMILLLRKEKFGSSSEKTPKSTLDGQICLFNEAEAEANPHAPEPVVKDVHGYKRTSPKTGREERLKDLPVKEILCEIHEDDQNCIRCNTLLRPIGKETVREELEYIPAKLSIIRYIRMAYECPRCKHTDTPYIEKALTPSPLMAHSLASPSTVAYVMYQKYVQIEETLAGLTPDERYLKRLELEQPVLEAFWCWIDSLNVLQGSALGKAVIYARNQKRYMENYLLDGRCSLSNNLAENSIRPFTVGRKNWLFSDTPKGASASAAIYSLDETAKANGLNVHTYLNHLLLYMPDADYQNDPEALEELMPWSEQIQVECKQ